MIHRVGNWCLAHAAPAVQAWCLAGLLTAAGPLWAQPKAGPPGPTTLESWVQMNDRDRAGVTAARVVGAASPGAVIGLLGAAEDTGIWGGGEPPAPTEAPKLVFEGVVDHKPVLPTGKEAQAYDEALLEAHRTPAAAFARTARLDVAYVHLWEQPALYRGEVVRVEGRMKRLLAFEAPEEVRDKGVEQIYEGWIFEQPYGGNPVCVVFTDLPQGMKLGKDVEYFVRFDGYFFKKYRYQAGDATREAPLLIGHAPVLLKPPSPPQGGGLLATRHLAFAFLTMLAGMVVVAFLLVWLYHRAEHKVRRRLAAELHSEPTFPEPEAPAQEDGGS